MFPPPSTTFGSCSLGMLLVSQGGALGLLLVPLPVSSVLALTFTALHHNFCLWDQGIQDNPGDV